jgi:hypothetical protein
MPAFNYNINWNKIIEESIPSFLHSLFRIQWIIALIKPFKMINSEFAQARIDYVYKVRFNSEIQYLEKILNDRFDPTGNGIYISDGTTISASYKYYKSEARLPKYVYWRWKPLQSYLIGDFAVEGNYVYQAITANTNKLPSINTSDWQYYTDVTFRYFRSEWNVQIDFIVNVPASLIYNSNQMNALINFYRLAGKRYKIVTY